MQIETFKSQLQSKLDNKQSPAAKKARVLIDSIDNNLPQILPGVERSIVVAISQTLGDIVQETLAQNVTNPVSGKYSVAILGQLLELYPAQSPSNHTLQDQNCQSWFKCLLWQTTSDKRPIRRQAMKSFKGLIEARSFEIFSTTINHFKETLQNYFKVNILELNESSQHAVAVLGQTFKFIPFTILGDAIQYIIKQIQEANDDILPHLFLALETILLDRQVSSETTEKIITQLLQLQTDMNQTYLCHSYLQCLRQCIISLVKVSEQSGGLYLPSVVSMMIEYLLQENTKLQSIATAEIIKVIDAAGSAVLEKCQQTDLGADLMLLDLDNIQGGSNLVQKYVIIMQYLLSPRFDLVSNNVLQIISSFFESVKPQTFHLVEEFIVQFVNQKGKYHRETFEKCFGKLVNSVNLSQLLGLFPINIFVIDPLDNSFEEKSNCWLLNAISKHADKVDLAQYLDGLFKVLQQALTSIEQLNEGQQRVFLGVIIQLFEILNKCKIDVTKIANQSVFIQQCQLLMTLIVQLMNDKLPFFPYMIKAAERVIPQLAYNPLTEQIVKEKPQQLIQSLAKMIVSGDERCRPMLNLIRIVAFQTSQEYLQNAINRNMEKISEIATKNQPSEFPAGLKNFDILIQVIPALKFSNDTWDKCVKFTQLLLQQKNKFQKKVYKFITEIISKVHYTFLDDIVQLVVDNTTHVQPPSRQKRFQVLQLLLEKQFGTNESSESRYTIYDFQKYIQNFLPEIVVAVRDTNVKTRFIIAKLLESIGKKLLEIEHLEQFISMVLAGLGASTSMMKSDAIAAVSLLFELFYSNLTPNFVSDVTSIILLMIKEKNNEIYKAVLSYFKALAKSHKKYFITQMPGLDTIITELLDTDVVAREKNVIVLKRLIMRFTKAYGVEVVEKAFPEKHLKLLRNIRKVDKRTKKNKEKKEKEVKRNEVKEMAERLTNGKQKQKKRKNVDSDMEDTEEQVTRTNVNNGMEEEKANDNNLLLKYDFNKEKFHFTEDFSLRKKIIPKEKEIESYKDVEFKNGKVIVKEEKENISGQKRRRENRYEEKGDESEKEEDRKDKQVKKIRGKQGKDETVHIIRESGETYKSKSKAQGDVLIKGRPEPFAFIQLNPKVLNKRFRAKAQKAFDQVLSKKSGALKGLKAVKK